MVSELTVDAPDGAAEAYLAGEEGRPGVLFFMDAFGLRPRISDMVERIAGWGYTVLAPNLFHREGSAAALAPRGDLRDPEERERFMATGPFERVRRYTPALSGADTEAWVDALAVHAGPGRIGSTGYCMGARLAVRAAGFLPQCVAAGRVAGGGSSGTRPTVRTVASQGRRRHTPSDMPTTTGRCLRMPWSHSVRSWNAPAAPT